MKRLLLLLSTLLLFTWSALAQQREVKLTLLETTDIHGNYLPYDFINGQDGKGSMSRIVTYVKGLRQTEGADHVVLLDNGDILQGQPTAYYYNYMDTKSKHLCAEIMNYMQYDAATVGNHDVETGHAVYDRWVSQCAFPMLGANVIVRQTGKPYWKPYTIIERQGIKIAILGMITAGIPMWLPENLWSGLRFDDMIKMARHYMPEMRQKADVVVGLFHSGVGMDKGVPEGAENASVAVAREVPGFDVVFCGHDHRRALRQIVNTAGDSVWVLNPAAQAEAVAKAEVTLTMKGKKVMKKHVTGELVDIDSLTPDADFMAHFKAQSDTVKAFTSEVIGYSEAEMQTTPAFFGPSAFIDFIHSMQLSISDADISFAAPLAIDAVIPEGPIHVRDMFNLYRYENLLYVMKLTGQEVKDYLEYSYAHWTNQMKTKDDHLMLFRPNAEQLSDAWQRMQYPSYNFDSAAGILYTVDLTKPAGQKVTITQMADGRPFSLTSTYRCAVNSYRGNGGGGLLTDGAHIPSAELPKRIVWSTEKDLRYYLMLGIKEMQTIHPVPLNQWKFVPEDWAEAGRMKDEPLVK